MTHFSRCSGLIVALWALLGTAIAHAQPVSVFTDEDGVTYRVERVTVANYPVALAFATDGRLFYTEKNTGSVRLIDAEGVLQREPVITLPTSGLAERGMVGIALDPDYDDNGMIWVYHTAEATARDFPANNLVRFREQDGRGTDPEVMLSIPITQGTLIHNGGGLRFDDEGYLFLSIGDYEDPTHPQNRDTLPGKIHRFVVTEDGLQPAPDNPIPGNSLYAYGLRNAFRFDFDIIAGRILATENGTHCDDEINLILPGFNYGAGEGYVCGGTARGVDPSNYLQALLSFTPTQSPTGIVVYRHPAVPQWEGRVFFCVWNDGYPSLRKLTLDAERRTRVEQIEVMALGDARCRIDIAVNPVNGALYFTTVGADGGAIYRLVPLTD